MASYEARSHVGAAKQTTLSADITSGSTSLDIAATTGWPSGSSGPFTIVINRDHSTEEKIDCSGLAGNTITVNGGAAGRGFDNTSAAAHTAGESVELTFSARDFAEANRAVNKTIGKVTAAGDLLVGDAANSLARLAKGSNGNVLLMSAGAVAWGALPTDSVGSAQIAADAVGSSEIAADTVGISEAADAVLYNEVLFAKTGTLATGTGTFRWYPSFACTIVSAWASVGTVPTGATLIVDVNRNGTTIFTTQTRRPTIAISGNFAASGVPDGTVTMVAGTNYLTVDIDQIGSTIPGSDLTVGVLYVLT